MTNKSIKELAAEAARAIQASADGAGTKPVAASKQASPAVARGKNRPDAFNAIFDKALAKLGEAHEAMKGILTSGAFALHDARPLLSDPRSPRDRSLIKGGRALDGIVYLVVPVGKSEWRASFGRECVNYATLVRSTDKRHPITPLYGDMVIAYVHTGAEGDQPVFVEVDPHQVEDVEAWVEGRVGDMMEAITRQRSSPRGSARLEPVGEASFAVGMVARMDGVGGAGAKVDVAGATEAKADVSAATEAKVDVPGATEATADVAGGAGGEGEPGVPGGAGAE